MNNFDFCGHAWIRHFFLMENTAFREFTLPGGAALVAALICGDGCAAQPDSCKKEYIQLERVSCAGKAANSYFAAGNSGWTDGDCLVHMSGGGAAIVWDEGFGGIRLPESVPVLWASNRALPSEQDAAAMRGRGFLLLDADILRHSGAMINRQVSWELSATDLIWQLNNNPAISYLNKVEHIVIVFSVDGAVYINSAEGKRKATLVLASGGAEGTLREKCPGAVPDAWACMAACCALQFPDVISGAKKLSLSSMLSAGERMLKNGYDIAALEAGELQCRMDGGDTSAEGDEGYAIPLYDSSEGADPHYWCISSEAMGRRIFDVAFDYVKNGGEAIKGLPHISFGNLTTVDRREIEAYSNIKNLITEYAETKASRPLSIVAFGAPGSGKSFGVTQIAMNVLPGHVVKMEFNVSQFMDNTDLASAFHQVRDVIIGGKLPLVFFDEFDSDRDGRTLGWLKSFLVPMQDGKFRDVNGEHPIGKCILVFAGGTSTSFQDFIAPMRSKNEAGIRCFKDVKGPDFVSRLRGTVDVLGPNKVSEDDNNYILRRALLLRSLCERKLPLHAGTMPINDNVLKAMLLVPKYLHGARSMEAILDMSRIDGATWEPASLPFYTQLSLHVDADVFIRLVLNEVRLNSFTDKLAYATHLDFVEKNRTPGSDSFTEPWDELDEETRESNRRQARSISQKLSAIGCSYDAGDTPFPSVKAFEKDEIIVLARLEHDLWMAEKIAAGWVYGTPRDNKKKIHPDLVPWEKLTPEEQQKDIDTVENIIPLLEGVGLRVYRTI